MVFFFEDASADRDFFFFDAGFLERDDQVFNGACVTKVEFLLSFRFDASLGQVVYRRSVGPRAKLIREFFLRFGKTEEKRLPPSVCIRLERNFRFVGKHAHSFGKREILVFSKKRNRVTARAAAKAAEDPFVGAHAQ